MAGRYTYRTYPDLDKAFIDLGFPYNSDAYRPVALRLVDRLYGFAGGTRLMGAAAAKSAISPPDVSKRVSKPGSVPGI